MTSVLDYVPDEDRELLAADAEQILTAVRDSDWLAEDPAGDDEFDRDVP